MKSIDVIYKLGNLYNRETQKRIILADGAPMAIVVNPEDVLDQDPNLTPETPQTAQEKESEIRLHVSKERGALYWKVFDAGKKLYFQISAGVRQRNNVTEKITLAFELTLLEDLYIYNKKEEPKDARFFECQCLVSCCLDESFLFFEPTYAKSLNDAYTKTYELYFAMFGKSTANAFDRFFESKEMRTSIRGLTEHIQKKK